MDRERKLKLLEKAKQKKALAKAENEEKLRAKQRALESKRVKQSEQFIKDTKTYIDHLVQELKVVLDQQASDAYDRLQGLFTKLEPQDALTKAEAESTRKQIAELMGQFSKGITVTNIKDAKPVIPPSKEYKLELPEWLNQDKHLKGINEKLQKLVAKAESDAPTVAIAPESQKAPDFLPIRRVIKEGNKLVFDDVRAGGAPGGASGGASQTTILNDGSPVSDENPLPVDTGDPSYYSGTVSATAVNVVGLIDGASVPMLELQHRGTQGQFKFTLLVEGTDDSTATGDEAAGSASTAKGWSSLEVRSASGAEMSSIVLGGRYLLYNPPRKIRIRCSSYTFGTAEIFVMTKPTSQQDPSRIISDKDALSSLAMTTFGQAQVAQRTFLAGSNFDDGSLNTDVWSNLNANGGSHTFANGVLELHTGTSSNGLAGVRSLNLATVLGGSDNVITIRNAVGSITDGQYVFRLGVYTAQEGTFIQMGGNARTVTDAVFNATTTMTSATAAFTAADLGKRITSTNNVTIGTTITKIVSATEVLLSAAALTSATAQTVDIEGFGVVYANRKGGVDTTSTFGTIGFTTVTPSANSSQLWEMTVNPNFVIVRNSGNFAQLLVGSSVLAPMFSEYDLPLTAEAMNLGSTSDHVLYLQTLTAERLGQPSTIRANETFGPEDVLQATASIVHGEQPDGDFVAQRADGTVLTNSSTLLAGATYTSAWINTDGWASAELFIATDQVSASTGIEIEFTDDVQAGTPTERGNRFYTFAAADVTRGFAVFRFPTELDGLRIKYTNGGVDQGAFFLALNLRVGSILPQASLEAEVNATNVAAMMRSLVMAKNDSGTYGNITRGTSGGLRTSVNQHEVETPIKSLAVLKNTRTTVGGTAVEITASAPLANRRSVSIKAICSGSNFVYIGSSSAVTTSNGYPLANEQSLDLEVDATTLIWAIASAASQAVAVLELGT